MDGIGALAPFVSAYVGAKWRVARLDLDELHAFQERRARRVISLAAKRSPFYRAHWSGYDLRDWRSLPTVDKALMMEHFDTFNTRHVSREAALNVALQAERSRNFKPTVDGLTVGMSSGTSGRRGLFLVSTWEQASWAGTILSRALPGYRRGGWRVAFFLRSNSNLYEKVGGRLVRFRYFDLMMPLAEAVAALNSFEPHIIVGPPALLSALGTARRDEALRARPERLISVAEVLEPQVRKSLEECFEVSVHEIYQCTEGLIAISCARGTLHLQEDIVAIQTERLPGGDGRRVTPIVTDLWRLTQPIVRYRLNDVLQLDDHACDCGSSFRSVAAIEGRCDDVCYFYGWDRQLRPFYPDTIRRMLLLSNPAITDYQVVQERPGHLAIYVAYEAGQPFALIAESVHASVTDTIARYDCKPGVVTVEPGIPPLTPGSKRRRVQNMGHDREGFMA